LSGKRRSTHGKMLGSTAQPAEWSKYEKKQRPKRLRSHPYGRAKRNDVNPEQKQAIEEVIREVKRIRRKPNLKQHEIYQCIRTIWENLVRAFTANDA
jgi:hypothetical protein